MHTHPTFGRATLGGAAGTLMMTAMMYLIAPMMGLHMDIAAMLGSMLGGSWAAGMMMHVVNGAVLFPALYAFVVEPKIPGSPAARGALWGAALWVVAQTMVMPMMGAGMFSSAMGGPMAAMASLVGHLLYGAVLGTVAGTTDARVAHA